MIENRGKEIVITADDFDLRAEIEKYFIYWKWFVLAVLICLFGAFVYLRYATPKYSASTVISINQSTNDVSEELSAFQDLRGVSAANTNILNEIQILKSRKVIRSVVKKLNLIV